MNLTRDEVYWLDWLAKEDGATVVISSTEGDGPIDSLIAKGLVTMIKNVLVVTEQGWKEATGTNRAPCPKKEIGK